MIKTAGIEKEVTVTAANKIGLLAEISKIAADHGINIDGIAGYAMDKDAKIMMVTNDATRTVEALKKVGYSWIKESEVIVLELENKPGALKIVTERLAVEGIDIKYIYGTSSSGTSPAKLILATSDNQKALVSFKRK